MISNVREHSIKYRRYPAYQAWRGPGATYESDEEWATSAQRGMQARGMQMD